MLSLKPEEDKELRELLTKLANDSKSKIVFFIDKAGQLISRSESPAFSSDDITFASLTAGNVAASEALSKLLGEKNLSHMFTETEDEGIYMIVVKEKYILVVIFDKNVSNLGIVRVKIKKYYDKIAEIMERVERRIKEETMVSETIDVDDIDLDALFE
ncbi:Predicted regulator of Ras-like GTPase activity, Roadblock/LC7/MglB family [Desulfurobacterium pacificum]|jgi:predicted regulator of Ras-like GTPase activity (Roadblock/LC7/MglB family)|uniref:Predicted regulator of Ras-like GTPase activity, Roadblock/LC7/MglB family n=1 Tax=Desulfurobacterium pacificum TaxID=240166 RepID=A0ABY1NMD9_9BACT|nr:roadblock/LC7 domain-containing protein [Desulfurobacterium pacificum]SMP13429.1 Predicted regulator of Ras-like GTPase activity, Roadblock/LC7/MglB family [Desulfurobacterium pacificum]